VQGSGWAAAAAGHVYDAAGTYTVGVSFADDDGASATSTTVLVIGGAGVPVATPGGGDDDDDDGSGGGGPAVDQTLSDGTDLGAPPLRIPSVVTDVTLSQSSMLPGDTVDVTATVTHDGATLVVPGLLALSNSSGAAVTVAGADYQLEILDVATNAWLPLASGSLGNATMQAQPIPTAAATYPPTGQAVAAHQAFHTFTVDDLAGLTQRLVHAWHPVVGVRGVEDVAHQRDQGGLFDLALSRPRGYAGPPIVEPRG